MANLDTTKWRRYRAGDVVEFDAIAAGVSPRGQGRLVKTQFLLPLPPVSEIVEVCWNVWMAGPFGGNHDRSVLVGEFVVIFDVTKMVFTESGWNTLGEHGVFDC